MYIHHVVDVTKLSLRRFCCNMLNVTKLSPLWWC